MVNRYNFKYRKNIKIKIKQFMFLKIKYNCKKLSDEN